MNARNWRPAIASPGDAGGGPEGTTARSGRMNSELDTAAATARSKPSDSGLRARTPDSEEPPTLYSAIAESLAKSASTSSTDDPALAMDTARSVVRACTP